MKDLSTLTRLLDRARRSSARRKVLRSGVRIAEDYAGRLEEKARMRKLLDSPERDGERFRFYFSRIYRGDLSEIRRLIDEEIERDRILQNSLSQKAKA